MSLSTSGLIQQHMMMMMQQGPQPDGKLGAQAARTSAASADQRRPAEPDADGTDRGRRSDG
jgi:hypothetical protein